MQLLTSILRSHVRLHKTLEPLGKIVDYCTTGWRSSFILEASALLAPALCEAGSGCANLCKEQYIYLVIEPIDAVNCFNLAKALLALPNV